MNRTEIGFYNLTQLHKSNNVIIGTCLVDGDIDNRFDAVFGKELQPIIWEICEGNWDKEKIVKVSCTFIDIDGQPENPIIVEVIPKSTFYFHDWNKIRKC